MVGNTKNTQILSVITSPHNLYHYLETLIMFDSLN